ncbi:MAG: CHAT domain-containing protein [Rhodocyclaceae bacterium]|nr:CHAT domain-containing protein [Rhodocyclaceae bacterium]
MVNARLRPATRRCGLALLGPFLFTLGLVLAGPLAAAPLGNNLADEACEAAARDDLAPEPGLPADLRLRCNDRESGNVVFSRFFAGDRKADDLRAALIGQYKGSRAYKLLQQRMTCRDGTWFGDAPGIHAIPCNLKDGGWPHLVVIGGSNGLLSVADGPPANWPVLTKVVTGKDADAGKSQLTEQLRGIWGGPVVLATAGDLARFKQLLRDGRSANGVRKFKESEDLIRQALEIQTRLLGENDVAIADTLMDLAINVSNQGRAEEAQALFRRAEPIIQRSPKDIDRARFTTYQGIEAANRGDFAAALQYARSATEAWRKMSAGSNAFALFGGGSDLKLEKGELAMALNLEARMALRNDDPVSASAAATEALLIIDQTPDLPKWWKSDLLLTMGEISGAQGRLSAAETYLNGALAARRQMFGEGPQTLAVMTQLGRVYQAEAMNTSAIISFRDAFKVARGLPQTGDLFTAEELMPFAAAVVDYAASLSDETARQGLFAEAFDAFQMVRSSVLEKTIAQAAAKLATSDPAIAALIESTQSAERERDLAKIELAHEQSLADEERSAKVEAALQQRIATSDKAANDARRELDSRFPDYAKLASLKPLDLIELRKRLGDREGLVSFLIGRKQSFVQVVRRNGIWIARASESAGSIQDTVKALRRALEIQGGAVNEFDLEAAHELYKNLFKGIEAQLQGLDHLIVVPSGALASLPFGLLVTQKPASNDYTKAQWLTQRISISHVPSLQAFFTLRAAHNVAAPPKPLLAFGDPVLKGAAAKKGEESVLAKAGQACRPEGPMARQTLLDLPPLPETSQELKTISGILRAGDDSVFLRDRATETNLRALKLDQYRVLYFATHGLLPGELKCQAAPGLVLTPPPEQSRDKESDGLLEAGEIANLRVNADLVVLSACNTAGGGGKFGGEALSGLAEAFFNAGARSMIVSHWQVPSAATAQLMSGTFAYLGPQLATGSSPALRDSQIRLIANKATAHPFFWAAFVVVGDGLAASTPADGGLAATDPGGAAVSAKPEPARKAAKPREKQT